MGKNNQVCDKVYLFGNGVIMIGNNFIYTSGDNINPMCRNICGSIGTLSSKSSIIIGDNVGISSSCIWAKTKICIGDNVIVGGDCLIMDHDSHPHDYKKRRKDYIENNKWENIVSEIPSETIIIEDDVWIGARCQILKGVHIGARSIIAAGSVVTKSIPSDVIAGGIPCKVIRKINN